jgi:hypothetical protein
MLVDSTVAMQTGMRTADLLALFSGEIGVISTGEDPVTGLLPGVLMLPSARGDAVLGLIRTLAGGLVQGEEKIAGSTVLRIGLPAQPQGGETPLVEPFLVAVTPSMVMVGAGKSALQAAVARSAGRPADSAAPMAADRTFQAARRTLPAELNGLNYIDVKRFQWDAQVAQLRQMLATSHQATLQRADEMEKGGADVPADAEGARKLREGVKSSQSLMQAIEVLFPLLPKHLRTSTGGSWKAADGLFFDSFVD